MVGGRSYAYQHDQLVGGRSYAYRHDQLVDGSQAYRCDSCQIQVAVRCERRVVIVVERRARLSIGRSVDRRPIGATVVFVRRRIGTAVVSFVGHGRLGRT